MAKTQHIIRAYPVDAEGPFMDVIVQFGDGSLYLYPGLPLHIAIETIADPDSTFSTIRYWPGYEKIKSKG